MAKSAKEAIRKERHAEVDDVWVDDDWKKNSQIVAIKPMGFKKK